MKNALTIIFLSVVNLAGVVWAQTMPAAPGAANGETGTTATLLLSGQAPPDGNGTFSGFVFTPVVNASGEVAVIAEITGTVSPPNDQRGIYLVDEGGATKLVRGGEAAPDGNGFFNYFDYDFNGLVEQLAINDGGAVAFAAFLTNTDGVFTDNSGLFSASAPGGVKEIVRLSDAPPEGNGSFGSDFGRALSAPGLDNQGKVSFYGRLIDTTGGEGVDDSGVYRFSGSSEVKLLRLGQTEPFGADPIVFLDPRIASNRAGQVAMPAGVESEFPSPDENPTYIANANTLVEVFRSGVAPPDGDGFLGAMMRPRIADNGHLTFEAWVSDTVSYLDEGPRLFFKGGATFSEIVRQGELGPNETELFRFSEFTGFDSNDQDQVVFSAVLERNAVPPDNRTSGIYGWDGGDIALLVHQGDPAPDGIGTFGEVAVPVFINNRGQIVFSAPIEGTPHPGLGDQGIFLIEADGTVVEVARTGKPLAGSTILFPQYIGAYWAPKEIGELAAQLAGMNPINDTGQVPFTANLTDGRIGLFLFSSSASGIFTDGFESGDVSAWSSSN